MGRSKKRRNNPPAILMGTKHHHNCMCDRCLDSDPAKAEKQFQIELERAWESYNKEAGVKLPNIRVTSKESPVIGPFEGKGESRYVTCPMAVVFYVSPKGKRRK